MPQSDRRSTRVQPYYGQPLSKSPASDSRRSGRVVATSPKSPAAGSPKRMASRPTKPAFALGTTFDANDKAPEDRIQPGCRVNRPSDSIKDMFDAYDSVVRGTIHIEGVNYSKYESCKDRPERINGFLDAIKDDVISEVGNGVRREDIKLRVYPGAIKTVVLHYDEQTSTKGSAHRDPRLVDAEWSLKIDYGIRAKDAMRQQNIAMALYGALTSRYGFSDGKTQNAYKKFIDRGATDIGKIVIAKPPEEPQQPQIVQQQQPRLLGSPQRNPNARPLITQPLPQPQQQQQPASVPSVAEMQHAPIPQQQPARQMPGYGALPYQHHNPPPAQIPAPQILPPQQPQHHQPHQHPPQRVIHQPPLIVLPRHEAMDTVFASQATPTSLRTHVPPPEYSRDNNIPKPSITPTRSIGRPTPPAPAGFGGRPAVGSAGSVLADDAPQYTMGAPPAPFDADRDRELARLSDEIHRERMKLRGDAQRSYSPQSPDKYYHDTLRNIQQGVRRRETRTTSRAKRHDVESEFSDTHYVTTEF